MQVLLSCVLYFFIRNPRFVQGTQEDSHEALRCLFDAIKNEEIEVYNYACVFVFISLIDRHTDT